MVTKKELEIKIKDLERMVFDKNKRLNIHESMNREYRIIINNLFKALGDSFRLQYNKPSFLDLVLGRLKRPKKEKPLKEPSKPVTEGIEGLEYHDK